jgi:hypothetical protein
MLTCFCSALAQAVEGPAADANSRRDSPGANGTGASSDAIALCDRLAGTERDVCLEQARENREQEAAPPVGASPGGGASGREQHSIPPAH